MAILPAKIETPDGHAIPPAPRHSITVHLHTWQAMQNFVENPAAVMPTFCSIYPRMMPHRDIQNLTGEIVKVAGVEGKACFLFASLQSAKECYDYATSPLRSKPSGHDRDDPLDAPPTPTPTRPDEVEIRVYEAESRLYAVFFPSDKAPIVAGFWMHAGVGISSRMAEQNLKFLDRLKQVSLQDDVKSPRSGFNEAAHQVLRTRIADLLDRAPINVSRPAKMVADDVYLFPTGMAGIYKLHTYMLTKFNQSTVLFGIAFHSTFHIFDEYGPGYKFFGLGTDAELDDLEKYLEAERQQGRKVQAVFTEFPNNPLLSSPDLVRLRRLADEYGFVLVVDDTISGFANVDLLDVADVLITSLTKAFSGYADVIAGGLVLNPSSRRYSELKQLFNQHFVDEFYHLDADTLEHNSRDYLSRTVTLNKNAAILAEYFQKLSTQQNSVVEKVYYPPQLPDVDKYKTFMRPATDELTPGFGCLLNVEFEDLPATIAFIDNLQVHHGPHLGAHLTLALPYSALIYHKQHKWASQYDMRPQQIRISVGLEDSDVLLQVFHAAVEAAQKAKADRIVNGSQKDTP